MSTVTRIDDRDPSVVYSRPQNGHHWSDHSSSTHESTLKLTRHGGSTASITFQGTSIVVTGRVSERGIGGPTPVSSYQIDNERKVSFTASPGASAQTVVFYRSPTLAPGTHTLTITSEIEGAYFWLDAFDITPNPAPPPTSQPPSPETPSDDGSDTGGNDGSTGDGGSAGGSSGGSAGNVDGSTGGSSGTGGGSSGNSGGSSNSGSNGGNVGGETVILTVTTTESSESTNLLSSSSSTGREASVFVTGSSALPEVSGGVSEGSSGSDTAKSGSPVGAIVGGVLGGMAVILLLIAFLLWRRKKKRDANTDMRQATEYGYHNQPNDGTGRTLITPFSVSGHSGAPSHSASGGMAQPVHTAQHSFDSHGSSVPGPYHNMPPIASNEYPPGGPVVPPVWGTSAAAEASTQRLFLIPMSDAGSTSTSEKSRCHAQTPNTGASIYASSPEPSANPHHHQHQVSTSSEAVSDRPGPVSSPPNPEQYGTFQSIPSEAPPSYYRPSTNA